MSDPVELARAIAGAQAQDLFAGPLTFRSRSRSITAADVDRARTEERSLLRTWVMRMTIHLIPSDDAGWMLPLFEPGIDRWSQRRLAQLGMAERTQDRALSVIAKALKKEGPLTRPEAAERVTEAGIELNTQTRLHLTMRAVTSCLACLGPDRGRSACLVLREEWLGRTRRFDREEALAELARRYLAAFGPATDCDFAKWAGLGLGELRGGIAAIAEELAETRVGDQTLLWLKRGRRRAAAPGQLRMLGAFDTYMLGYANRDFALPREHVPHFKAGGGGWLRPILVRDGVVVGGWHSSRRGGKIEVRLEPPKARSGELRSAIDSEIADISRFEGMPVTLAGG